jgi:hypothetical protein
LEGNAVNEMCMGIEIFGENKKYRIEKRNVCVLSGKREKYQELPWLIYIHCGSNIKKRYIISRTANYYKLLFVNCMRNID